MGILDTSVRTKCWQIAAKYNLYHNKCALRTQSSPAVVKDLKPEKNQKLKLILVQEQCIRSTTISLIFAQYWLPDILVMLILP